MILVKFILTFLMCFGWVFFRLDPQVMTSYPRYMTFSDFFHSIGWFAIVSIIYLEWNRSIPHHWSLRLFWFLPVAINILRVISYTNILNDAYGGAEWEAFELRRHRAIVVTILLHILLALVGVLGFIPKMRDYLEPNRVYAQYKPDLERERRLLESKKARQAPKEGNNESSLFLKTIVTRSTVFWIASGFIFALARGGIMQVVFIFYGLVFQSTQSIKDGKCSEDINDIISSLSEKITMLVGIFVTYAFVNGMSIFLLGIASEKIANGVNGIRNKLFKNMIEQEMGYLQTISTGVLVSRFSNDAERIKRTVGDLFPQILEWFAQSVVGLIILFNVDWEITLYMIAILPLTYAISYYQSEIFEIYEEKNQHRTANMTSKVQDVFSKLATVMIYDKKSTEKRQFAALVNKGYRILCRRAFFSSTVIAFTEFLSWGTTVLGLFLATSLLVSVENLKFFVIYGLISLNVIKAVVMLLKTLPKIGEAVGASHEIMNMMYRKALPPEGDSGNTVGYLQDIEIANGDIEFQKVIFAYPTAPEKRIFNGLNLKIPRNSKVAIVGDSGAGKSTILHLIARFYDVQGGSVLIDGQDIKNYNTASLRKFMAIVSQDSDIFAMSILENILYGHNFEDEEAGQRLLNETLDAITNGEDIPHEAKLLIDEAMTSVEGAHALDFVQGRLDFQLGEGGKGLSGGQKQRLTIARALYKDPKILLLDEVTSALDQQSEEFVQNALDRLVQNRTVLIVAHRLHTIQNADKIIVMQKGKITAEGKHDELLLKSERYRELVEAAKHGKISEGSSEEPLSDEMVELLKALKKGMFDYPDLKKKYSKRITRLCPSASTKNLMDEEVSPETISSPPSSQHIPLKEVKGYYTEDESDID